MKKVKFLLLIVIIPFILSGCWDVINLEDRGFIVGTGIDIVDSNEHSDEQPQFAITNQLAIPAGVGGPSQEGTEDKAFLNITSTGESIYRVNEEVSVRSSKDPFYEHLSILIISENAAKTPHLFSNLLDTYIRNVNMRRGTKIAVSEESPEELLEFTTPENKLPALHIEELLERGSKQSGFLTPIVLGDIEEYHLSENSYVLPLLNVTENVQYLSGAVFQGAKDQMVGSFNSDEMKGLEIINEEAVGRVLDFVYKDQMFAMEVVRLQKKTKIDPSNIDQIKVTIDVILDGIIKESFRAENFTESKELDAVQSAVSKAVEESIENAIEKGQKELNADVFEIWQMLESKHYDTWKKVKDDWEQGENYFSNVTFDVNVISEVYSIGTTNKTD